MQITNLTGLPDTYLDAVTSFFTYENKDSDISVTQLMDSPRIVQLKLRHEQEIKQDVTDLFWSMLGNVAHLILERHGSIVDVSEKRFTVDFDGFKLSGKMDCYHEGTVTDYKLTSVYTVKKDLKSADWEQQINLYAYLLRMHGYTVNKGQIFVMMRDWMKSRSKYEKGYPAYPVLCQPVRLWSDDECDKFLYSRLAIHKAAYDLADNELPLCSEKERWATPEIYAVHIGNNKNAYRKYESRQLACACFEDLSPERRRQARIETRPGVDVRCIDYCPVNQFCDYYQKKVASGQTESTEIEM